MGGLLILFAAAIGFLAFSRYTVPALTVLFVTLGCGAIGFLDDFIKLTHRRSLGLSAAGSCSCSLAITVGRRHRRRAPRLLDDRRLHPGRGLATSPLSWAWYVLLFLVIAGAANGVNLTDGLDGLAAGSVTISLFTFTAMNASHVDPCRAAHRVATSQQARHGDARRGVDRGRDRVPLVQRLPGRGLHGRHRLDGARRRARRVRDLHEDRSAAAPDRRDLRDRGALGDHPGLLVQVLGRPARLPDGADPPPLRDEGVVGDEDHGALLDRRPAILCAMRLRVALLPLLPRVRLGGSARRRDRRARAAGLVLGARRREAAAARSRAGARWRPLGRSIRGARRRCRRRSREASASTGGRARERRTTWRCSTASTCSSRAPACPGEAPRCRRRARARGSRSGARSSSGRASCRTRFSASPGRTARRRRPSSSARCSRRAPVAAPATSAALSPSSTARSSPDVGRLRAVELPARGRARARPRSRCC